jgi:hypothetical protein
VSYKLKVANNLRQGETKIIIELQIYHVKTQRNKGPIGNQFKKQVHPITFIKSIKLKYISREK